MTLELKVPPPVVAILVAAAMWAVSFTAPALPLPAVLQRCLALGIALGGVGFDLLGLAGFLKSRTTVNPLAPHRTTALVTGGIYRVSRNPMYVGLALLLIAWAVQLSALWPFIGPVLFVLYMNRFQIGPEERILARAFGEEYAAYAARVRRWL